MSRPAKKKALEAVPLRPMVVGGRYCMACGRYVLGIALGINETLAAVAVGRGISACCNSQTALLLIPGTTGVDPLLPGSLPLKGPKHGEWQVRYVEGDEEKKK